MKTRFYIILSIVLLMLQTGCVNDKDTPIDLADKDYLVLNLNLSLPSVAGGTRSDNHKLLEGSRDESYFNIEENDFKVLIFDEEDNLVEEKLSDFEWKENIFNGILTGYTLTAKLSLSDENDRDRLSTFKVMVLANWQSFERSNTRQDYTYPLFSDYSLKEDNNNNIFKEESNLNFILTQDANNTSWVPNETAKKAIPMFGITESQNLQYVIDMSKYGDAPSFNVPMLRSLAKIEIVDMVPDGKKADIDKVTLSKYNTSGRFIPDIQDPNNLQWSDKDVQIDAPSIPYGVSQASNLLFFKDHKTVRTEGATEDEIKDCFVAYIPEMELGSTDRPEIQVKLKDIDKLYTIEFRDYVEGKPDPNSEYASLLRNHNYLFNIKSVETGIDSELILLIETPQWDVEKDIYDYNDMAVEFGDESKSGLLKWDRKYDNVDPEDALFNENPEWKYDEIKLWTKEQLNERWNSRFLLVSTSEDSAAEGEFTISQPARGTWTLSLFTDDETDNHWFYIQLWDETQESWALIEEDEETGLIINDVASGKILASDNEPVRFRIMAQDLQYEGRPFTARLVMNITTFDGRMSEVNLITGDLMTSPDLTNYTTYYIIKQNPSTKL